MIDRLSRKATRNPTSADRTRPGPTVRRDDALYLSLAARGLVTGSGVSERPGFEVRRGADGVVSEPPAASPDGSRVAVVVRQQGKRHLAVMSADGTNSRTLAPSIEIQGVAGQGPPTGRPTAPGSSPGATMAGSRLVQDSGRRRRAGAARHRKGRNPVWSPKGDLIVYAAPFGGAGGATRSVP